MTVPMRPVRRVRRGRRFDLRATAMFFLLLAIILCLLSFLARMAAGVVERRPLWAGVLAVLGLAAVLVYRSRRRRISAGIWARQAARTLEEAAEKASDSLAAPAPGPAPVPQAPAPAGPFADPAPAGPGWGADGVLPGPARTATVPLDPGGEERTAVLDPVVDYAALDPDGFEQAIAELCARDGCRDVEVVGGAGDLGADVVAVAPDGRRVVVQCKQYGDTNKVGSQDMQRFGGTCFAIHEAEVAAVVTTSGFTEPALEYARQCGIVCVDGDDLQAWCGGSGPAPWHRVDPGA
ncbi:restriction endonuclease [Streptomyces sp. NPDC017248]|uniref:restriction endonuclease n=1 Tax=unclassified Streptomyces TaxID=2593676 RepID=UPI00378B7B16